MQTSSENLRAILAKIETAAEKNRHSGCDILLVGVSKAQPAEKIETLIGVGLRHFGENRVQEAAEKWPALKARHPEVRLHLIGPLQSNKVSEAVALFDVIETIDREKIARAVAEEIKKQGRTARCLVQVNIGKEPQKSGIAPEDTGAFLSFCREECDLPIEGLMCIPPAGESPAPYFALLKTIADRLKLKTRSMGMSGDFEEAIRFGATEVRIGTALFGARAP